MISALAVRLGLPLVFGLVSGAIMLGLIIVGSDGTEPRGICEFVGGDGGFLPLNPNKGGTYSYSCDLNMPLAAFYILAIGVGLSVFVHFIIRLFPAVFYPFTSLRIPGKEIAPPGHRRAQARVTPRAGYILCCWQSGEGRYGARGEED